MAVGIRRAEAGREVELCLTEEQLRLVASVLRTALSRGLVHEEREIGFGALLVLDQRLSEVLGAP